MFAWVFASLAFADGIVVEGLACPAGTRLSYDHSGTWCEPVECGAELGCDSFGLCVLRHDVPCGGRRGQQPCPRVEAASTCGDGAACAAPAVCETKRWKVDVAAKDDGAWCATSPGGLGAVGVGIGLVALAGRLSGRSRGTARA